MRGVEDIDQELSLAAAVRAACIEAGGPPPAMNLTNKLLDERLQVSDAGGTVQDPAHGTSLGV